MKVNMMSALGILLFFACSPLKKYENPCLCKSPNPLNAQTKNKLSLDNVTVYEACVLIQKDKYTLFQYWQVASHSSWDHFYVTIGSNVIPINNEVVDSPALASLTNLEMSSCKQIMQRIDKIRSCCKKEYRRRRF